MGVARVTSLVLIAASVCFVLTGAQEEQVGGSLKCYACTYRTVAHGVTGAACNDPFESPSEIANITCDTHCMKRMTTGGVEKLQRGCYSDFGTGACEEYTDRAIAGSDPPEMATQYCCRGEFCNHGNKHTAGMFYIVVAMLYGMIAS